MCVVAWIFPPVLRGDSERREFLRSPVYRRVAVGNEGSNPSAKTGSARRIKCGTRTGLGVNGAAGNASDRQRRDVPRCDLRAQHAVAAPKLADHDSDAEADTFALMGAAVRTLRPNPAS
jgi:hypothetical protein